MRHNKRHRRRSFDVFLFTPLLPIDRPFLSETLVNPRNDKVLKEIRLVVVASCLKEVTFLQVGDGETDNAVEVQVRCHA
jgi:hypothetical protein